MRWSIFEKYIGIGQLTVIEDGQQRQFGEGEPRAGIEFLQPSCLAKILRNPQLNLGATYVSGGWRPAAGSDLHGVLKLLRLNFEQPLAPGKLSLTLAEWHRRFTAQRVYFAAESGEHFCRTWEFYLAICQTAFEVGGLTVHHWQLQRPGGDIPVTRDYLYQ